MNSRELIQLIKAGSIRVIKAESIDVDHARAIVDGIADKNSATLMAFQMGQRVGSSECAKTILHIIAENDEHEKALAEDEPETGGESTKESLETATETEANE